MHTALEGLAFEPLSRAPGLLRAKLTQVIPEGAAGCPLKELPLFPRGWGRGRTVFTSSWSVGMLCIGVRQLVLKSRGILIPLQTHTGVPQTRAESKGS